MATVIDDRPRAGSSRGVAKGSEGRPRFTPADGGAERRDIVALVEQDGRLREKVRVAR